MAELNVFELTNQELHKTEPKKESAKKPVKATKRPVKESVKRAPKRMRKPFGIPANKLKFESLNQFRTFLEGDGDESDVTNDFTPDDDLVLVIDPEMDEVPEDVEEAEAAAEELIGNHVCKCSICGANYVTDADIDEELEIEDETCPVCGETGDQIVVGVITPMEELSTGDEEEITDVDIDDEDGKEEIEVDETDEDEDEDEDDFGESVRRQRRKTMARRAESVKRKAISSRPLGRKPSGKVESAKSSAMRKASTRKPMAKRPVSESTNTVQFDEITFNRMLTKFAKENYENVRSVKISKGSCRGKRLTLEGVVTTTKGSKRPIKFVAENFSLSNRMTIRFKEIGPFTESVENKTATFIVECAMRGKAIVPMALKYSYKTKNASVRESKNMYEVKGSVMNESAKRTPAKRTPAGRAMKKESVRAPRKRRARK